MRIVLLCFSLVFLSSQTLAQTTFIKNQGFGGNKISGAGLIAEYNNHFYFSFALNGNGPTPSEYVVAKYDTLGNFLSKKTIGKYLFDPSVKKTQMAGDTTFYTHFLKYSSQRSIAVIQKNSLHGKFLWNTSTAVYIEDFIGHGDSLFLVGRDTNSKSMEQQAIFAINPDSGTISQKRYFTDISEFTVSSYDTAFNVVEITAIDSSLFVLFHRKADSAKYVYEFDQKLNYKNHFEIANDAFRFLDNEKFLVVFHKWRTVDFISKGRAQVYNVEGQKLWKLEEHLSNLNHQYSPGRVFTSDKTISFSVLNYDQTQGSGSAWREIVRLNFGGKILRRFKMESATYGPGVSEILPIKYGYLIQARYTDYESHIIRTDSCFNAKSDKYPDDWVLEFPNCGKLETAIEDEVIDFGSVASIYPNPTSGNFKISTRLNVDLNFKLISLNGQQVHSGEFLYETQLDVSHLPNGIYFLQLHGEGIHETRKVVVSR